MVKPLIVIVIRLALWALITLSLAALVRFSYQTGHWVGQSEVRVEAMDRGFAYFSFQDGQFHWIR